MDRKGTVKTGPPKAGRLGCGSGCKKVGAPKKPGWPPGNPAPGCAGNPALMPLACIACICNRAQQASLQARLVNSTKLDYL